MCDYEGCYNPAEFLDALENLVCEECMEREVDGGVEPEEFERFRTIN